MTQSIPVSVRRKGHIDEDGKVVVGEILDVTFFGDKEKEFLDTLSKEMVDIFDDVRTVYGPPPNEDFDLDFDFSFEDMMNENKRRVRDEKIDELLDDGNDTDIQPEEDDKK